MNMGVRGCINCTNFKNCLSNSKTVNDVINYRTFNVYFQGQDCFKYEINPFIEKEDEHRS